jgi:hypothetical protein
MRLHIRIGIDFNLFDLLIARLTLNFELLFLVLTQGDTQPPTLSASLPEKTHMMHSTPLQPIHSVIATARSDSLTLQSACITHVPATSASPVSATAPPVQLKLAPVSSAHLVHPAVQPANSEHDAVPLPQPQPPSSLATVESATILLPQSQCTLSTALFLSETFAVAPAATWSPTLACAPVAPAASCHIAGKQIDVH